MNRSSGDHTGDNASASSFVRARTARAEIASANSLRGPNRRRMNTRDLPSCGKRRLFVKDRRRLGLGICRALLPSASQIQITFAEL